MEGDLTKLCIIDRVTDVFWMCFVSAHQTHYEQFGKLTGTVNIEGHGQVELNVIGVRDHSYGYSH